MKLAILAVIALAGVAYASKTTIYEKPDNLYRHAERLGVFKEAPFLDLYKQFAVSFVTPYILPKIDHQDPRNYRPSYDVCRDFFQTFVNNGFEIYDFDEVVVLDACLAYVLEGHYNEPDENVPEETKGHFDKLAEKEQLKELYKTSLGKFPAAEKTCVADLLLRAILAKKQHPEVVCNNHMIQVYLQFAECQEEVNKGKVEKLLVHDSKDSYVSLVYNLLRRRVDVCFEEEVAAIENAVTERFSNQRTMPKKLAKLLRNEQKRQQAENMWPKEVVKVLAVVQNSTKEINLRQVHQIVTGYVRDDSKMEEQFLQNLAYFAQKELNPTREGNNVKPKSPSFYDKNGSRRYEDVINDLCNPFRVSSSEKHYNFALSVIRLAQLLQHQNLFNISVEFFLNAVLQRTYKAGPVYLSIYSCNLMSYTDGYYKQTEQGKPKFQVAFKPDISKMVIWPSSRYI